MAPFFSSAGLGRLNEMASSSLLCAFDFDGTLAPIVTRPEDARLPAELQSKLIHLDTLAPVAIITGRSIADISARLGFVPRYILGNHGIEGLPGWEKQAESYLAVTRSWKAQLHEAAEIAGEFGSGVHIEDKGYSLSVHYRMAQNPNEAADRLRNYFPSLDPEAHVIDGKFVFNLLPHGAGDKGRALVELMQLTGASGAVYVGDDVTDEDVFKLHHPDILSVRIDPVQDSAADFYLKQRTDVGRLIDELITRIEACDTGSPRSSAVVTS